MFAKSLGKKGSMIDYMFFLVVFLVFAMSILAAYKVFDSMYSPITTMLGNTSIAPMNTVRSAFSALDYVFLFLFVALNLVPIFLAVMSQNHPIFIVINIVLLLVYIIIAPVISNVMRDFWSNSQFSGYAAGGDGTVTFPIMTRIFQYLPLLSFAFAVILTVAMFAKGGGSD